MKVGKPQCRLESRMVQFGTVNQLNTDYMGVQLSGRAADF